MWNLGKKTKKKRDKWKKQTPNSREQTDGYQRGGGGWVGDIGEGD